MQDDIPLWLTPHATALYNKLKDQVNLQDAQQKNLFILLCDSWNDYCLAVEDIKTNTIKTGNSINPSIQIKKIVGATIQKLLDKLEFSNDTDLQNMFKGDK